MPSIAIDPATSALLITDGGLSLVDDDEEIRQWLCVRLRLFRGECFMNLALGMNQVGLILKKGATIADIHGEFTDTIEGTPGVVSCDYLRSTPPTAERRFSIQFGATINVDDLRRRASLQDSVEVSF